MDCFPGSFFFLGFSLKYKLLRVHSRRIERLSLCADLTIPCGKGGMPNGPGVRTRVRLGETCGGTLEFSL